MSNEPTLTETKATHTPGPWRAGVSGSLCVYGPDNAGEHSGLVAQVFKGRANANLIAAAPELLEALRRAVETIRVWSSLGLPGDAELEAWTLYQASPEMKAINAVIAKAEGRS